MDMGNQSACPLEAGEKEGGVAALGDKLLVEQELAVGEQSNGTAGSGAIEGEQVHGSRGNGATVAQFRD
jgi:hypothetical protein